MDLYYRNKRIFPLMETIYHETWNTLEFKNMILISWSIICRVTNENRVNDDYWAYDWENQIWIPNEENQVGFQDFHQSPVKRNFIHDIFGIVRQGFTSRQGGIGGLAGGQGSVRHWKCRNLPLVLPKLKQRCSYSIKAHKK